MAGEFWARRGLNRYLPGGRTQIRYAGLALTEGAWINTSNATGAPDLALALHLGGAEENLSLFQYGFVPSDIPEGAAIKQIVLHVTCVGLGSGPGARGLRIGPQLVASPADPYAFATLTNNEVRLGTTGLTIADATSPEPNDPLFGLDAGLSEAALRTAVMQINFGVTMRPIQTDTEDRGIDAVGIEIVYGSPAQGYAIHPQVVIDRDNGGETEYDLRALITDASGPTRSALRYDVDQERPENVLHDLSPTVHGFRPQVALTFDILTNADQATLATIVSALRDLEGATVTLSLDAGVTYREVILRDLSGPVALGGKSHVGARYVLTLQAVDLVDEWPELHAIGFGDGAW